MSSQIHVNGELKDLPVKVKAGDDVRVTLPGGSWWCAKAEMDGELLPDCLSATSGRFIFPVSMTMTEFHVYPNPKKRSDRSYWPDELGLED